MKLYKFRQVDTFSLSSLSNNTLWFSNLDDFNDPFEGSYVLNEELSERVMGELITRVVPKPDEEVDLDKRNRLFEEAGVTDGGADLESFFPKMVKRDFERALVATVHRSKAVCMSMEDSDPSKDPLYENLMWSHYADGLRGFCMIFDGELLQRDFYERELSVRPIVVDYQDEPVCLNLEDFATSNHILNENPNADIISDVTQTIGTKSTAWSYEKEFRMLSLEDSNLHSYPSQALIEIVLGEKMPLDQRKLVLDTARSANPDVVVKIAQLRKGTYSLEIIDYQTD